MKSLSQQFAEWVRSKPADERYCFIDGETCAFAQFEQELGIFKGPRFDRVYVEGDLVFPPWVKAKTLEAKPWTFGALAERLAS